MKGIIYKYTSPSNKSYIGQTIHEIKRKNQHKRSAFNPNDVAYFSPFHKAIRTYGWDSFSYEVLYTIIDNNPNVVKEALDKMEIYYIGLYDSFKSGYNCNIGGNSIKINKSHPCYNHKLDQNHAKKLKESTSKRVYQFDLNGNFIAEFNSTHEAAKSLNKESSASTIAKQCRSRKGSSLGYQWRYTKESPGKYIKPSTKNISRKKNTGRIKAVIQLKDNNIIARYISLMEAARCLNTNSGSLWHAIHRHIKHLGYYWQYDI